MDQAVTGPAEIGCPQDKEIPDLFEVLTKHEHFASRLKAYFNKQLLDEVSVIYIIINVEVNFVGKMVTSSARNTNIYKTCKLHRAIFSVLYNISQPNFQQQPFKLR